MSMDFGFDVISEEEYQRQHALYGPLTEALRNIRTLGKGPIDIAGQACATDQAA